MKNSKSRIPIAAKTKTSSLKNTEKVLLDKQLSSGIQASHAGKRINSYSIQKNCPQKCSSQINESGKLLSQRTVNTKSRQSSTKLNVKSNDKNVKTLRTNINHTANKKEPLASLKTNLKTGLSTNSPTQVKVNEKSSVKNLSAIRTNIKYTANKREPFASFKSNLKTGISTNSQTQRKSNARLNVNKNPILPSSKSKEPGLPDSCIKSCDNVIEKLPVLKSNITSGDDTVEKFLTPRDVSTKGNNRNEFLECLSAQKNIKFEANEFYRNLILSNRELSPSICKFMPSLRASCLQAQRPSAYKKFEVPLDPAKEAFKAIEDVRLSVRKTGKISTKENRKPCTPFKERHSFYTPCADPRQEVFKTLEDLKLKRLKKSEKKVTFNLNIDDSTPKNACDEKDRRPAEAQQVTNSENRLTQIKEKNEENSCNLFQNARSEPSKQSQGCLLATDKNDNDCKEYEETVIIDQTDNTQRDAHVNIKKYGHSVSERSVIKQKTSLTTNVTPESLPAHSTEILLQKKVDSANFSPNFICDRGLCESSTQCQKAFEVLTLEEKTVKSAKIYTPRPISLFSKSFQVNSSSPEFLFKGKSMIPSEIVPICTPLVLRSIAKNNLFSPEGDLSPVRLKLDFNEEEKDTTDKETSKSRTLITVENIMTIQKKQEFLADQECCILLKNENTPIICGRYLANPVALTLSEGDDMHFIPIQH